VESYVAVGLVAGVALAALTLLLVWAGRHITATEVEKLSKKRRQRALERHFRAGPPSLGAHPAFKSSLRSEGRFYPADIPLDQLPWFAGSLLKYKKHEWIVFCLVAGTRCLALWANKGLDKTCVIGGVTAEDLATACAQLGCDSVVAFHNHPTSRPEYCSYHMPSNVDRTSAARQAQILNAIGVSLLAFVCERGRPHRYAFHPAANLFPLPEIERQVESECNRSRWTNLRLRWELLA
jgi:hypothetical protein